MKSLTNSAKPLILKIIPKAGYGMYFGENRPMREKESWNRNSGATNEAKG
jgi:hypothetical protein